MSVYRVLDKLEAYVHEGTWLPAGYRILSEERLIELLEKIRASLPEEVGRAKVIAKDHDRMMRAAQEKAQAIVDDAASKHEGLVEDSEILRRARTTADVVLREAEEKARKVREGADRRRRVGGVDIEASTTTGWEKPRASSSELGARETKVASARARSARSRKQPLRANARRSTCKQPPRRRPPWNQSERPPFRE